MKCFGALVIFLVTACLASAAEITDPVVKMLLEKGIVSEEEAIKMDQEILGMRKPAESPKVVGAFEKIQFEGLDYIGYTYKNNEIGSDAGDFEIRRGYFVAKAYVNDTDYLRTTLDVTLQNHKEDPTEGSELNLKLKHLYYYKDISEYVPATGFEFGLAHTPWLDYEEHSGWWYRSVEKTFYEADDGAHLLPSADLGVDFSTRTEYVAAEYGLFNGEGYDHIGRSDKGNADDFFSNAYEARVTGYLLGGGKKKLDPLKQDYLNASAHWVDSVNWRGSRDDLKIYQGQIVYNQPRFLVAGQCIRSEYTTGSEQDGQGFSFNGEVRPCDQWSVFGRWDRWHPDKSQGTWDKRNMYIYGIAWAMSSNVRWILNAIRTNFEGGTNPKSKEYVKYMLTAEVAW